MQYVLRGAIFKHTLQNSRPPFRAFVPGRPAREGAPTMDTMTAACKALPHLLTAIGELLGERGQVSAAMAPRLSVCIL